MKTKQIISVLFLFFSLFSGCSENIIEPLNITLSSQLSGKWESKNYEILNLNNDGTFIDTTLAIFADNPNEYVPHTVVDGKYYVTDSIVYFYDVNLLYAKAAESAFAFGTTMGPRKIGINGNNLTLQHVQVFNPKGNNYPYLNGQWESISWVGAFNKDIIPHYNGGKQKRIFNFNSDLLMVNYSIKYLFNTNLSASSTTTDYSFDGNVLKYGNYPYFKVKFKNNKMYWFSSPIHFVKQ